VREEAPVSPLYDRFSEGDRCIICLHWWWDDGKWHSLVPKPWLDHEEEVNEVVCPLHISLDDLDQMIDAPGDGFPAADWCKAAGDAVGWARHYELSWFRACWEGMALEGRRDELEAALRELIAWLIGPDALLLDIDRLIVKLTGNAPGAFADAVVRASESLSDGAGRPSEGGDEA
jgi:hypothetical protein